MSTPRRLSEIVGAGYDDFLKFKGRYLIVKGGRGSKKSTTAALKIITAMMKYPLSNAVVIRQVFNTQKDSTFKQLQWACEALGVSNKWRFTVSPLEATYLPTGQKIYFRGMDNPLSITSITVSKGYLCYCWFEEAYQITSEENFNKVDLSLRGKMPEGYYRQIIMTFNPWSDKTWIKKRFFDTPDNENKLTMTTTYECNEWLDDNFLQIMEEMRQRQPRRYRIEGDGNWGVSEGLVFDNWRVEDFCAADLDFSLSLGLDFGWKDPTAISVMRVDEANKRLYLCEEYYHPQKTLDEVADWLKANGYQKSTVVADSAEPRSIGELKQKGIRRIKPCKKGAGSIMEGIRKLQQYEIIIHPTCENAIIEFENYAFDKDKFDNWIDKPIDDFCHIIDSMRYGLQGFKNNSVKFLPSDAL